jgi:hypothetical protein
MSEAEQRNLCFLLSERMNSDLIARSIYVQTLG